MVVEGVEALGSRTCSSDSTLAGAGEKGPVADQDIEWVTI